MWGCIRRGRKPLWAFNRDDTQWRSKQCVLHLVAPTNHLEILLKFCSSGLEWAPSSNTLPGGDNTAGVWTTVLTKIWEILSGRTFQETLLYKGMKKGRGQNDPEESSWLEKSVLGDKILSSGNTRKQMSGYEWRNYKAATASQAIELILCPLNETGSPTYKADLTVTVKLLMTWTSDSSAAMLLAARITGLHHLARLENIFYKLS